MTLKNPASIVSVVPFSSPGKLFFVGFVASTIIVKSDAVLFPASSLMTFLITVRKALPGGGVDLSLFVMVQVRNSPGLASPIQSSELDEEYSASGISDTE